MFIKQEMREFCLLNKSFKTFCEHEILSLAAITDENIDSENNATEEAPFLKPL